MAQRSSLFQRPLFWFIAAQICFVVYAIYREHSFIQQLYRLQKVEQTLHELTAQRKELYHQVQELKQNQLIKSHAVHALKLQPIKLSMIRPLHDDDQAS